MAARLISAMETSDRRTPPPVIKACSSGPWRPGCSPRQQVTNFLIGGLGELLIPLADGIERFGSNRAHHFVELALQFVAGSLRSHRNSQHQMGWLLLPYCAGRSSHAGPGGQTIINQDYSAPLHINRRPPVAIKTFAPLKFFLRPGNGGVDLGL